MCYDDTKTRFYFFDADTGAELWKHPYHNAIVSGIGERKGDTVTELWIRPLAPRNTAPYTWERQPQRLTAADFHGKTVKVKVWSPYPEKRETIYLAPEPETAEPPHDTPGDPHRDPQSQHDHGQDCQSGQGV